jgi:hypothetical protein
MMDIPREKNYPPDAVQCHGCGGHGCSVCGKRGWVSADDPHGRLCLFCDKPIRPAHVAVYCSNECALRDADAPVR